MTEIYTAIGLILAAMIYGLVRLWQIKVNDIHGIEKALKNLRADIGRVEGKIDGHIEDHAKGEFK